MKKLIVLLSVLAMPLLFTSCELFEDECEEVTHIETQTNVSVILKDSESGGFIENADLKITTWKTHCDGHKGYPPVSEWTGKTNEKGYYNNRYTFGYTMKTKKDFFTIRLIFYNENGKSIKEFVKEYSYADVENYEPNYIIFNVSIPISEFK